MSVIRTAILCSLVGLSTTSADAFAQNSRKRRATPRTYPPKRAPFPSGGQRQLTPPPAYAPPGYAPQPGYPPPPNYQRPPAYTAPMPPPPGYAPPPSTQGAGANTPSAPSSSPAQKRNQNPLGQPAAEPPHMRNREDLGGIKNWFGTVGSGLGYDTISRTNPGVADCSDGCQKTIEEPRWAMQFQTAAGWGPIRRKNLSFTTHYRYMQNLRTNQDQAAKFGRWFKTFNTTDFIFPTRDMLRSHELVAELRYSMAPFQFGLHAMLDFERVGSNASFLGEPNEVSDSVRNIEQVVPWIQWRIPKTYIATLYSPLRTEINKEDPRNSFTTWSLSSKGRGIFLTLVQDNLWYLPKLSSVAGLSLNWTNKKSASIQNDSSRLGARISLDFPIAWDIRVQPYFKYDKEDYILQRIRINNLTDGSATLVKRSDSIIGSGAQAYLDLYKSWRLFFLFSGESTQSSLNDFSGSKLSFQGGFNYSLQDNAVLRRLNRFSDFLSAEEN